jgi:hypothetical protein
MDQASLARASAGCGPNQIQFDVKTDKAQHPLAPPESTKAVIYVISEWNGQASIVRVGMDGRWMGANRDQAYFFFMADPGEHRLCMDVQKGQENLSDQGGATTFTAEPGKVYFFRTSFSEKSRLARIDNAEGLFLVSSWPLSTSRPKPRKDQ